MFISPEKAAPCATPARSRARTDGSEGAQCPSCSNTRETQKAEGRIPQSVSALGNTLDGSESVRILTVGKYQRVELTPLPLETAQSEVAHIDYLAATWSPPDLLPNGGKTNPVLRIFDQLQTLLSGSVALVNAGHGWNGYKEQHDLQTQSGLRIGWIACGGERQRGTVHLELTGSGCALVTSWQAIKDWFDEDAMRITRVDLAHDDIEGKTFSMEKVRDMYQRGDFNCGGRMPSHNVVGDWFTEGSPKGRTFYIGRRENGKMLRFYEKGKEQGDSASSWIRCELELKGKNRNIPTDVLTHAGNFLAGSYPALNFLSVLQEKIRTIIKATKISLSRAIENGRQLVGKLVNVMMIVSGGDAFQVINDLKRDGYPGRLLPFADHLLKSDEVSHAPMVT